MWFYYRSDLTARVKLGDIFGKTAHCQCNIFSIVQQNAPEKSSSFLSSLASIRIFVSDWLIPALLGESSPRPLTAGAVKLGRRAALSSDAKVATFPRFRVRAAASCLALAPLPLPYGWLLANFFPRVDLPSSDAPETEPRSSKSLLLSAMMAGYSSCALCIVGRKARGSVATREVDIELSQSERRISNMCDLITYIALYGHIYIEKRDRNPLQCGSVVMNINELVLNIESRPDSASVDVGIPCVCLRSSGDQDRQNACVQTRFFRFLCQITKT